MAFKEIKKLVLSPKVLTIIDHNNMGNNNIYVFCDASDIYTGTILIYGESLQSAYPVAFKSQQLRGAELNYPVHEKELLSIVRVAETRLVARAKPKQLEDERGDG